ncbi:MAG: phenylacetate--CoA ligase family protein [Candidatus Thermoplasmatota archaeon]|nr:phenylacetate--CoA ligase family protein [Candidatus Thermoplasmatota archaeon]MBS3801579.1 phenylacetate--CoA ligase family protein [Candidatus Thermoplasmatota archaeon]
MIRSYNHQRAMVSFLKKSERWSKDRWEEYQFELLKKIVSHCYKQVPYYKRLFAKYDIKIDNMNSLIDFNKIPFLTRQIVEKNRNELKAINFPEKTFEKKKTSGTTNEPLTFYVNKEKWLSQHFAYNRIFMKRAGYKRGKRTVSILGIREEQKHHRLLNTLELSSLYLDQSCEFYLKKIEKFHPHYIVSYPSAIYFLAKFLLETQISLTFDINAIFCHGEPIYEWQRETIEKGFHCKLFDIYGNGEKNVLSATCEKSYLHHVFPNYCFLELIDINEEPVTTEGSFGEIVSTGLQSYIFPFIRYKTGDIGIYTNQTCSCGRKYPIVKRIEGRITDGVLTKSETLITASDINKVIDTHSKGVLKWQFIQEKKGELQLFLVLYSNNFSVNTIKKNIKNAFKHTFSNQFDISIQIVKSLKNKSSRKHHFLIQKLPVNILNTKHFP